MADIPAIYQSIRESEMNAWVGGDDPQRVGELCFGILERHIPMDFGTRLLDFGSGIGRVALTVLEKRPFLKELTGIDIVPKLVQFCNETIASQFSQVDFALLDDKNAHYERFKDKAVARTRTEMTATYGNAFDAAYAFSVFTHIDEKDFSSLLRFVATLLQPGGRFLFTAFILTPYSRAMLEARTTRTEFAKPAYLDNGEIFVGNPKDKLAFIAFDIRRLEAMIWEAGLIPCTIEYGEWRGGGFAPSLQDVIVCRKPLA